VRQAMREELKLLQLSLGTTFVFVTHDQDEALTMATRVGLMNQGRVEQVGTPPELYRRPTTRFVANFIGDQSFVPAVCKERRNSRARVQWLGKTFFPFDRCTAKPGETVEVMLRPEDVRPNLNLAAGRGVVRTIAFHGATVEMTIVVDKDVVRTRSDSKEFEHVRPGDRIDIQIEGETGVAFDWDS